MRPRFLLITLIGAPGLAGGQDSMRDLERLCSRIVDDPRPANLTAMQVLIDSETGSRHSYLTGCRLLAEQKWGAAGNGFEKAVKAEPDVAIYHFWFGRATGEQAQRANPIRQPGLARRVKGEFEKAAALDPTYIAPHEGLLRFYLAAPGFLGGSVDRARGEAEAITKINAFRGGLAHANVAFAARDTMGVIRAHEKLIADFPDSTTSYFTLLNVQLVRHQWAAAWGMAGKLEHLRPELPIVRYAIGRAAAESGEQLDRGEAALRKYLEYSPRPNEPSIAAAHWRLGMIAEHRGDIPAARQAYETAAKMDPNLKQAKDALARVK
jgi:tetratricopeptide (TPR) repeat protein